jgi:hypothetical protein
MFIKEINYISLFDNDLFSLIEKIKQKISWDFVFSLIRMINNFWKILLAQHCVKCNIQTIKIFFFCEQIDLFSLRKKIS